jgi:hypothetical protein
LIVSLATAGTQQKLEDRMDLLLLNDAARNRRRALSGGGRGIFMPAKKV